MARPLISLVPGIAHRLEAWATIQERLTVRPGTKRRPTITLSRAFGCEGYPLGTRLVELFSASTGETWNLYDKALLDAVEREDGIPRQLLERLGDSAMGLETLGLGQTDKYQQAQALGALGRRIQMVARVGNAVIVGRGGALLTHDFDNCFHFRLEATPEWRARCLALRLDVPIEEAQELVVANGNLRERFISERLGGDINAFGNFDAVFNNERHTTEDIARSIASYVKCAWPEPALFEKR